MADYSREQIYDAMRQADAAGDADAVKALAAALKAGASKEQILSQAADANLSVDEKALDANIASRDAGGPTNTFVPAPKPTQPTLADGAQNAFVGSVIEPLAGTYDFAQEIGKAPTYALNALTRFAGQGVSALGAEGVGNALIRSSDDYDRRLDDMPTATGLVRSVSPIPQGMENARLAANLIGGVMMPFGPKAKPRVQSPTTIVAKTPGAEADAQIVRDGLREKVPVFTSDLREPRSFTGKIARATGERIPYAGTGGPRVRQNQARVDAVKRLADDFGVTADDDSLTAVTADLAKTRGGKLERLTERKKRVLEGITAPFTAAPNTVRAINEKVRELAGIDAEEFAPVIERLQRFGASLTEGKTLKQIEGQRKLLGDLFADPSLAKIKGDGQKAINAIYGPLREDMAAFIKTHAGDAAHDAWKSSNDELSAMAGELKAGQFKNVLQSAETTPENVRRALFSQNPSDVQRLFGNLSPAGKERARAAVLAEAIDKAGKLDNLSPQQFANALSKFGKTTGIIFGNEAPRIEGIVRLIKKTQQASVAAAAPPTGVQNSQLVGATGLGATLGVWGGAGVAGAAGLAARLYESAPVRNLLVGLSKTKPGSQAEGAVLRRIESVLASQAGISGRAVNDNLPQIGRAAASPEQRPDQPNQ